MRKFLVITVFLNVFSFQAKAEMRVTPFQLSRGASPLANYEIVHDSETDQYWIKGGIHVEGLPQAYRTSTFDRTLILPFRGLLRAIGEGVFAVDTTYAVEYRDRQGGPVQLTCRYPLNLTITVTSRNPYRHWITGFRPQQAPLTVNYRQGCANDAVFTVANATIAGAEFTIVQN